MRLKDVAKVELGSQKDRFRARFNGRDAVPLGLVKQAVANPLDISSTLKEMLPTIQATLPEGVKVDIAYDLTVFIEKSIEKVYKTVGEAVLLVVLVIFLFLRSWRATLRLAHRHRHPGRPDRQARHPDRRVRQPVAGTGPQQARRGDRVGGLAAAADPDDHRRDGARLVATGGRIGRRRRIAQPDRLGDRRRHGDRDPVHPAGRAGGLPADRSRASGRGCNAGCDFNAACCGAPGRIGRDSSRDRRHVAGWSPAYGLGLRDGHGIGVRRVGL